DTKGSAADLALKAPLASPTFTGTVTGVTAAMVGLGNVDNTCDLNKPVSTATQTALDAKGSAADLALKAPLASPTFTGTVTGVTAAMVGLNQVNNTSDLAKPISTATQAALDAKGSAADLALKAPLASPAFTGTVTGVTATMVGLGNVDNTSDANKPVSTATQMALDTKGNATDLALKAPLASPAFTGTVTGVTAAMVGLDQVNNTSDLAKPISTAVQAALDLKGSTADLALKASLASPTFTGTVTGVTATMVGLGNVDNTSDANKPVSTATQAALDAKGSVADLALKAPLASPAFTGAVTGVTATMVGLGNVDNTSDANKPVSTATQAALDAKGSAADLALKAPLASPIFTGTVTGVTAAMVGLGDVSNTSDLAKPISTATQVALDAKEPLITTGTSAQYLKGDKTLGTFDKVAVGLGNVDNTSDLAKPISTATQTALDLKGSVADLELKAPLASPTFTGVVTLSSGAVGVTQIAGNNSVAIATTAYADAAVTTSAANKQNMLTNSAGLAGALSDETGTGLAVFATSPTLVNPNLGTPITLVGTNITGTAAGLTAGTVTTNANLTGEVTSTGNASTISNPAVIGKVLTGYTSGAGVIAATDNILQAIQKLNGNNALKAPLASPTFTGVVTSPTLELSATSNQIELQSAGVTGTLSWTPTTSNKVITLPNVTGNAEVFEATTAMGTTSQTITPDGSSIYTMTPSANATLTFSGTSAAIGSRVYLCFTATTASRTITFAGNCKKLSTLATGTTSGRTFMVCFIFDGTNWIEFSRTAALQ
ncbi:beta strand repeat-containing protein, partial [Pedobacter nyackensis]